LVAAVAGRRSCQSGPIPTGSDNGPPLAGFRRFRRPADAVKRLAGSVEDELAPLPELGSYLAVAHSTVTRQPPAELMVQSDGALVRVTVAVDHKSESGVLRHPNGTTQWFGAVGLPVAKPLNSMLWFEPAA
jgi:hypothetical protein